MALLQARGVPGRDPGEWFLWGKDPDTGDEVHFRIRRIPESVEQALREEAHARIQEVRIKKKVASIEVDLEVEREVAIGRAEFAWVGARGFSYEAVGEAGAAELAGVLGEAVEPGATVALDDRLSGNAKLKRHILAEFGDLRNWILEQASTLWLKAARQEDRLVKN